MPIKILRRCSICKKIHASYLVEDPERDKYYLCHSCWKATQRAAPPVTLSETKGLNPDE